MNPKVKLVHHVAIQTSRFEEALVFYTEILGLELMESRRFKQRQFAWLRVGDLRIELYSVRAGEALEKWSDFYSGPVHIAFAVEDLDAFLASALARGARFHPSHPEPFIPPVPGATKIAFLRGPDGEEVEIRQAVAENR